MLNTPQTELACGKSVPGKSLTSPTMGGWGGGGGTKLLHPSKCSESRCVLYLYLNKQLPRKKLCKLFHITFRFNATMPINNKNYIFIYYSKIPIIQIFLAAKGSRRTP